jgi:hypothetical protein
MPAVADPNVAQCDQLPKGGQKQCMALLRELNMELLKIVTAGEGNIELPATGSSVEKAKAICNAGATKLNNKQLSMCTSLQTSFTAKMEGIINGDADGGFCRLNAAPAQQTPCLALMSEMVNKLQAWAEMSSPRVVLPTGTPVSIAETVCDKQYPSTEEQRAECGKLFKSFGEKLYTVTAGKMGNKPQPPPAATMAAAPPAPKSPCGTDPKCPCPPAAAAPAAATGPAPKKEVKPESTGPDSTAKARALCDEVPEENVEPCKKFIIKMRYETRAIAEKAGLEAAELEAGRTGQGFLKATCELVKSPSETEECQTLKATFQTKLAALMAGPVGPDFSKSAPKPQPPNATIIVVNNTKAPVKQVEERAKVCSEMAKLSKLNAKECDVIIKDVKAAVATAKEANPSKKVVVPTEGSVLAKSSAICLQLEDAACTKAVLSSKAAMTQLQTASQAEAAAKGMTGAASATGLAGVSSTVDSAAGVAKEAEEAEKAADTGAAANAN